jgi:hypothetical protein
MPNFHEWVAGCCSRTRLATTPRFVGFAPQDPFAKSRSFVYHLDALAAEQVWLHQYEHQCLLQHLLRRNAVPRDVMQIMELKFIVLY